MKTKLENLKNALEEYLLEIFIENITEVDKHLSDENRINAEQKIKDYIHQTHANSIKTLGDPISNRRANKLKINLRHSSLHEFDYDFQIRKNCIEFIQRYAKKDTKLFFDLIELPQSYKTGKKIDFALSFENKPQEYYLVLDRDDYEDISKDFNGYKTNFDNSYKTIFDKSFSGNNFSNENTKKVIIYYDDDFKDKCDKAFLNNPPLFLYLNTGIVSYDLDDIIQGESVLNFFNRGQFTLYYSLINEDSKSTGEYGDVNPTSPPY